MPIVTIVKNSNPAHGVTFSNKACQWLAAGRWFPLATSVSSTNKTDHQDIAEILLNVALSTIPLTPSHCKSWPLLIHSTKFQYLWQVILERTTWTFLHLIHTIHHNMYLNSIIYNSDKTLNPIHYIPACSRVLYYTAISAFSAQEVT